MKKIVSYFFRGLIFIAPLGITIYALYLLFNLVDGILQKYIQQYLDITIPGLGILVILIFITLLGFVGQTIIARPFKLFVERIIRQAPLVKVIYTSIKDLLSAFVGEERKFDKPVLVLVNPVTHLEKMGFMTQKDLSHLDILDKVSVYFPHSYNFSGEMFIVPRENVRPLDVPAADAMKFIVSGGITTLSKTELKKP